MGASATKDVIFGVGGAVQEHAHKLAAHSLPPPLRFAMAWVAVPAPALQVEIGSDCHVVGSIFSNVAKHIGWIERGIM